jgi:transcription antitermination factor NusG
MVILIRCKSRGEALSEINWYAIHTRSNCEKRISSALTETGIESYLPSFQETRQWKDRKKVLDVPIFPGYVFARFADSSASRIAVSRTDGVVRILGAGDRIEAVPEEEIEGLRLVLNNSDRCMAHPLLREGSWVRVRRGVLKNLEGLLVRVKNQTRLVLSVTLLSRSVSTEVDARDVEYIRPADELVRRVA